MLLNIRHERHSLFFFFLCIALHFFFLYLQSFLQQGLNNRSPSHGILQDNFASLSLVPGGYLEILYVPSENVKPAFLLLQFDRISMKLFQKWIPKSQIFRGQISQSRIPRVFGDARVFRNCNPIVSMMFRQRTRPLNHDKEVLCRVNTQIDFLLFFSASKFSSSFFWGVFGLFFENVLCSTVLYYSCNILANKLHSFVRVCNYREVVNQILPIILSARLE